MKKTGLCLLLAVLAVLSGCASSGSAKFTITTTSASLPAGSISTGAAYPTTTLVATGGTAPYTWAVTSGNLPTGLALSSGGVISGTATATGTFSFTVTVTDSAKHTAPATLTITINAKLTITSAGTLSGVGESGSAYSATLAATGGVAPLTWTLNSGALPSPLTISSTGTITGTISASTAPGTYNFTAKVTDSQGGSAVSGTITITVDPALVITAPALPKGAVGLSYSASPFTASGGSGTGYTFAVASGSLPSPLTLGAATGQISVGPPTAAGTSTFTVKVTDSQGFSATTASLSITINAALSVTLSPTGPITLDQGKTQLVNATVNGDPNPAAGVTWSAVTGLGSLTGSTTTSATYNAPASVVSASVATFKATSVTDPTKSATFTVNLVPPPQITTTTMAAGNVNGAYSAPVNMTGGVAPYTWALTAAPTGLSLSASTTNTVNLQGTPTVAGANQTFTIKVTDAQGLSVTSSGLTITIYPKLTITPPALPTGAVGVNYSSLPFTASGGSGTGYTFTIASGSLPTSLTLGAATGQINAGPPTAAGTSTFTVKVTDSVANTATTASLSITINAALSVTLSPTGPITLDQGLTQLVTATVNSDPNPGAGVTWSAVTGLGSLSGSTTTSTTYNAPASVAVASTATFTASSITDPTKSKTFTVNLVPPPQITTTTMAAGNVNGAYSSPVAMTGGVAPYTWALIAAPAGLSLSASTTNTVTVQGTPTVAGASQTFTIKVTDAQGLSVTSSGLTITIYPKLTITPPALPTGAVGVNYSASPFTASGGSGTGYTFAIASGALPTSLTLGAATGQISVGPPTAAGTFTFTVKVTDSVANTATTASLSITINPALSVSLAPPSPVTLDQGKTQLVTATVNNDPVVGAGVTWSAVTGLGSLSGSTTTSTTYNAPLSVVAASTATFTATSITDPTKSTTYTINLVPPPQITTTTMAAGNVNGAYSSPVVMTGGVAPYTWLITAAPTGLSLNGSTTNTVTVQGTPTVAGANQTFTIKVTDAQGLSVTSSGLTITVYATLVLTPPSSPLPTGAVGVNYPTSETFTASGGSGAGYTWSVSAGSLPTGLGLSTLSGTSTSITAGPPSASGTYGFTVKLVDSVGNSATSALSITINPAINVTFSPLSPLTMDQNTSQLITATANNDPATAGVNWSVLSGAGSLTGSSTTSITYNAPASVASASTATFTATSITDPTKSATFTVNLVPPPVIATPTFPGGTVGSSYSSVVTEAGGVAPFTWTPVALPAGLSLSASTTNSVTVQGTPTTAGASQTATIKVTDAKGLTNTISSTITITGASCTTGCTISGTISGPWVEFVSVAISGGSPTLTDASGHYSFTGLAGGSYTITPTLAGYTYSPAAPSVATSSTTTTQNFTATPVMAGYSVSGTITYVGSKTGNTIIRVMQSGCSGSCGAVAGASFTTAPTAAGTAYIIRGLPASSSLVVNAYIDTLDTGIANESDPEGTSSTFIIPSADVSGVNLTVVDRTPALPTTPKQINIAPFNTGAVIQYSILQDSNGEEIPTSYKVYYGTDTNASNGAHSPLVFKAGGKGSNVLFFKGIPNGLTFFKFTAANSAGESAATTPISTTVGAGTGANTVSGTVTFPGGTPTGPLYVGVYGNSGIYVDLITSPTSPQAYSVSGVPSGSYTNFAIIDDNNDGQIDAGDISNVGGDVNGPGITVSGATTSNLTLTNPVAIWRVETFVSGVSGQPNSYSLTLRPGSGSKLPISTTLFSGTNVAVPFDMNADQHNSNYNPIYNNSVSPTVGDTYQFFVTYSDGTSGLLTGSVTAVLSASFPQNLTIVTTSPGTPTVPQLTWTAPATIPSILPYTYSVNFYSQGSTPQEFWSFYGSGNSNGIPSTQTNVLFNVDGSASPNPSLTIGGTYGWSVTLQDNDQNSAQYTAPNYVVP
jgi:hypothetical protein